MLVSEIFLPFSGSSLDHVACNTQYIEYCTLELLQSIIKPHATELQRVNVCPSFFSWSDIDECADGHEVRCGENAVCVNEVENQTRGFTCVCESGYETDILGLCRGPLCILVM